MPISHQPGSIFIKLDDKLNDLHTGLDDIGRMLSFKLGPASRDAADPAFIDLSFTPNGKALRPLMPVHLRARSSPDGISLRWLRRSRGTGDAWDIEPALSESTEIWRLDVLGTRGELLRRMSSDQCHFIYPRELLLQDFDRIPDELHLRICQESAVYGPGAILEEVIRVR